MQVNSEYHVPALLKETLEFLQVRPGRRYIDATLGGGGHSEGIWKAGGELLAIDCDSEAIAFSQNKFSQACPDLLPPKVIWGNFRDLDQIAKEAGFAQVDGIVFDLGVSSHQLETPGRGFSFNLTCPLDMRMDPRLTVRAFDLVNGLNEGELDELFTKLGEEKFARRFARAVCRRRQIKPIETGDELAQIILTEAPSRGKFDRIHPATQVFQALRIAVNDELNNLKAALPKAVELLNSKGRLVILSFHSLEDGLVKRFFAEQQKLGILKIMTEKPLVPNKSEISANPRARSAKLRAAEKE